MGRFQPAGKRADPERLSSGPGCVRFPYVTSGPEHLWAASLRFDIEATHADGRTFPIIVTVHDPVCEPDAFRWTCAASWSLPTEQTVRIYGVTSFQALRLALDFLEVEIPAGLPGLTFRQDGLPWPTPRLF